MRLIFIVLLNFLLFDVSFGSVIGVINDAVKIKSMLESFSSGSIEDQRKNASSTKMSDRSRYLEEAKYTHPVRNVYSDENIVNNSWKQRNITREIPFYSEKSKNNTKRLGNQGQLIKRKALFVDKKKRLMRLSSCGKKIAYVVREDNKDVIYTAYVEKKGTPRALFNASTFIEHIKFVGKNWIAAIVRDDRNYSNLILINLTNGNFQKVSLIDNAKTIEIKTAKMVEDIAVKCFNGKKYSTFFVQIPSLKAERIKEDTIPIWMIFDEYLVPLMFCSKFDGVNVDVLVCGKNGSISEAKFIERINIENEVCIAISGDYYYKLRKTDNKVQFVIWNLRTGKKDFVPLNAKNVKGNTNEFIESSRLSDYVVNLDPNGIPMFVTRNSGYRTNISLSDRVNAPLNVLNNKFYDSSWYRIDETIDGNVWLIKVCNPQKPSFYYLFNRKNANCIEVNALDSNLSSDSLIPVKCVQIPINNMIRHDGKDAFVPRMSGIVDKFVYGYLARVSTHDKAPLIIFVEADGKHRFSWEFDPMTQMLSNRGYNVLCTNCCIKHINDDPVINGPKILEMSSNIMAVVRWCVEKGIAKPGNISLVGKRANGVYCADAFIKNQGMFSVCLAISTDFPKNADPIAHDDVLHDIENPLVIINSRRNSEKYMSFLSNMSKKYGIYQQNYKYDFSDHASKHGSTSIPLLLFMIYENNPLDSDASVIFERIFSSIYNFVEEDIHNETLMRFPVLFDGTRLLEPDGS